MNYVISIISPPALAGLQSISAELEIPLSMTFLGHGTAVQSMLDLLGIESNEKRIVMSVANDEKTEKLIAAEKRYLHIGVPGHGIVIALPIKSVGGGKTVNYFGNGEPGARATPPQGCAYELIIAISNEGQTDLVMNAARAAGARGGTVLHGKGTGPADAEKFYNISIAGEKEVVMIVASTENKSAIMRSILEKAGPSTKAASIVFSLPASEIAGFAVD